MIRCLPKLFSRTWSPPCLVWLSYLRPLTFQLGMHEYSFEYPEACGFLMSEQNSNYHFFSITFPHIPHVSDLLASLFFTKQEYQASSFQEGGFETSSSISSLGYLVNKLSLWGKLSWSQSFGLPRTGSNDPYLVIFALYIVLMFPGEVSSGSSYSSILIPASIPMLVC